MNAKLTGSMLAAMLAACLTTSAGVRAEFPSFQAHTIDKIGDKMGQTSLVDVDVCSKPWNGDEHVFLENKLK